MQSNTCLKWSDELISAIQGQVLFNEPMSKHTTLQVGGPADIWVEPANLGDCVAAMAFVEKHSLGFHSVGRGSNLLVRDGGIRGLVLHVGNAFQDIAIAEQSDVTYIIDAGAGVMVKQLLNWAADQGLSGLEGLEGIPGTVGGAIAMNAGTPAGAIGDAVVSVTVLEKGKILTRKAEKLEFAYRKSKIARATVVLSTRLQLTRKDPQLIREKLQELRSYRQSKQPLQQPSVGSVFKNPGKDKAGKLIEEAGLKGVRVGKAVVSPHHANWIVNTGGATANDVEVLIRLVRDTVKEKLGIVLEAEVRILGEAI